MLCAAIYPYCVRTLQLQAYNFSIVIWEIYLPWHVTADEWQWLSRHKSGAVATTFSSVPQVMYMSTNIYDCHKILILNRFLFTPCIFVCHNFSSYQRIPCNIGLDIPVTIWLTTSTTVLPGFTVTASIVDGGHCLVDNTVDFSQVWLLQGLVLKMWGSGKSEG